MAKDPVHVLDIAPALRRAIVLSREAGLTESANELERRAFATYTTSSEWLGELGEAILQFLFREGERIPQEVDRLLDQCLFEVGRVWSRYESARLKAFNGRTGHA